MTTATGTKLAELGEQIASHLGPGWTAEPFMGHAVELTHTDGGRLFARLDSARLNLTASYPTYERRAVRPRLRDLRESITVSTARPPAAIAADITRRLLPDYERALADVRAQIAEMTVRAEGRAVTAARLGALLGVTPTDRDTETVLYPSRSPLYALKVHGPDEVRVESFTCTADQAAALIELMAK